jgi:hypothetical protein
MNADPVGKRRGAPSRFVSRAGQTAMSPIPWWGTGLIGPSRYWWDFWRPTDKHCRCSAVGTVRCEPRRRRPNLVRTCFRRDWIPGV